MAFTPEFLLMIIVNVALVVWHSARVSAKMEGRFTALETHMKHILNKLGMVPRE